MAQPPSPLVSLPAELQIKIVEELYENAPCPYEDPLARDAFLQNIKAVRLTCKALRAAASDVFLKTWFSHRCVVLERKSLLDLFQIATTSPFNTRMTQIDVAVYEFLPELGENFESFRFRMEKETRDESCFLRHDRVKDYFLSDAERKADWPNARAAYRAYRKYIEDQAELYQNFLHVRLLARSLKALSRLGELRIISVNGSQSPLTGAWTSGILQKCGISLLHKSVSHQHPAALLSILTRRREKIALYPTTMASVIRAMHLSDVEVCTLTAAGLSISALQLSAPQRQRLSKVGLGHLHNLSLRLMDSKLFPSETSSALLRSGLLSRFIKQAHNLMNLSIEFCNQPWDIPLARLLGPRVEKLENLSLGGLAFHAQDLMEWLTANSEKLDYLQLDYSSLITGTWREVFRKMRSNLNLKSVYFHFLADDDESIHITGENVNDFILKKSSNVDWDTMDSKKLPRNMGDLAGLLSVVVNGNPGHHHHHYNHHPATDGPDAATGTHENNQNQVQAVPVATGPTDQPDHASYSEAAAQNNHATAGPAPPPGHPANLTGPNSGHTANITHGTLTLPISPPDVMNAMQDLFQSALGVSLDFMDDLDEEDNNDLSDSFEDGDDDGDDFDDEDEDEDDDSETEDESSGILEEDIRKDDDGYQTDDSVAEAILDQMMKEL